MDLKYFFWDTNIFIYWLERHPLYFSLVKELYSSIQQQQSHVATSVLTLGELLVQPYKKGELELAQKYKQLLLSPQITLIHFSPDVADLFAKIRATSSLKPPDSFQLACAANLKVDYFVTNDVALSRLQIDGIKEIRLLEELVLELKKDPS